MASSHVNAKMIFRIAKLAFQSRLLVICLQFVANVLIPDHDAGVFNPPVDKEQFTIADKIIIFAFGGFRRWDAIYFLHIAQHGYTYENCVAFFPLYPLMISTSRVISMLCPFLSTLSSLLMFGVMLNVGLFVVCALILMKLGQRVMQDDELAYFAALLFCINPASIFMTAPYTETLFACLSFGGILCIREQRLLDGILLIGASALTRSNGLVSLGFILHHLACEYIQYIISVYRIYRKTVLKFTVRVIQKTVVIGLRAVVFLLIGLIPFVCFQLYIYNLYCFRDEQKTVSLEQAVIKYGRGKGFRLVGEEPLSPWCFDILPLSYAYIQSHHWGVGFMKYYQVKQIPNFILAAPVIVLSLCACYSFYLQRPAACWMLGLVNVDKHKVETVGSCLEEKKSGWHSAGLVVYVLHLLFLTCFGCCFMHIQVLTRFLCSASPVVYWFAAYLVCHWNRDKTSSLDPCDQAEPHSLSGLLTLYKKCSIQGKCVLFFFWGYLLVGTVAFSNFLPWT